MLAARKSSEKSAPEMFDDVPVLQRKLAAVETKFGKSRLVFIHPSTATVVA